jgi:hypothetical protein
MKLVKKWDEDGAYTFLNRKNYMIKEEERETYIEQEIEKYGCDEDLINEMLNEEYPETKYFVLVDYIDDRNNGYFHIRIWEKY